MVHKKRKSVNFKLYVTFFLVIIAVSFGYLVVAQMITNNFYGRSDPFRIKNVVLTSDSVKVMDEYVPKIEISFKTTRASSANLTIYGLDTNKTLFSKETDDKFDFVVYLNKASFSQVYYLKIESSDLEGNSDEYEALLKTVGPN